MKMVELVQLNTETLLIMIRGNKEGILVNFKTELNDYSFSLTPHDALDFAIALSKEAAKLLKL